MSGIRITGGRFKGKRITVPKGGQARFTAAKVREAVFDLVGPVDGLAVLDLFAGAGSFVIEALSRGAGLATAVESDRQTSLLIRNNLKILNIDKDCLVLNMDVRYAVPRLYRQGKRFDLVFADPPYEMGHIGSVIELLKNYPLCHSRSDVVLEHSKREAMPGLEGRGYQVRERRYGDTVLSIVTCGGNAGDRHEKEGGGST
jgi:16S rRNA (guanine966-N2)-methyltransferase